MIEKEITSNYLFEVSWEVCNKVGGIHTVVTTKALELSEVYKQKHILIGPDIWHDEECPEFEEDTSLFVSWKKRLKEEGLRVRVGRWKIASKPIVFLVDFTALIDKKDLIFKKLWERFQLDSLSGRWDYVEAALFGYATGMVIESFVRYNSNFREKVVAQFHEWMTGAGVLYIAEKNLSIGTVFTTHATALGRSIACNNMQLYQDFYSFNPDEKAKQIGISARHSLESKAAQNADVFTTVSEITARECAQFLKREVDIITPNGFDESIVPSDTDYTKLREEARESILKVAGTMHNKEYSKDTILVGISGRYEYKNKGLDIFLDAIDKIKNSEYSGKDILACIMVPAWSKGVDSRLIAKLSREESLAEYKTLLTHKLVEPEHDAVCNKLASLRLNIPEEKINLIFIPSYLNGNDAVFNKKYYDLLIGFDLTVFPSYYEPWGYTPLESLAYGVPTVTTSLAGFGAWVEEYYTEPHPSISVIDRNDSNYGIVVDGVVRKIVEVASLSDTEREKYVQNSKSVSRIALWENNIKFYKEAYQKSIEKSNLRNGEYPEYVEEKMSVNYRGNRPEWQNIIVNKRLPERLKALDVLSKNLWWCWNQSAIELFKDTDETLWNLSDGNPIAMLDMVTLTKYNELSEDQAFLSRLDAVYAEFNEYMALKAKAVNPSITYFSMEYGLDTSLKIYSGGLGILAGDYLKEASDMNVNMTAVGFLYKYGYFTQQLSSQGSQVAKYDPQIFSKTPAVPVMDENNNWVTISVAFPGRNVYAKVWRVDVGRIALYLLDTDINENLQEDRSISHQLYGGDWENRFKQELVLGIGGIRALRALNINTQVYHCNEGHAAFIGVERLKEYVQNNELSFEEALEVVRGSSLFTTHTPVPAGHDAFDEGMLRKYIPHYPDRLKISWEQFIALGKIDANNESEKFSMSNLASNLSQEINGVSWLHGKVSKDILSELWPGYLPEELDKVGYVTNGVHYPTWTAPEWQEVHAEVFGEEFRSHHYDKSCFSGIRNVSNEKVWSVRSTLKTKLINKVKDIFSNASSANHYAPHHIVSIKETLRDDVLTIGFARRFATYKRAHLLFRDLDRLNEIINNPERPVQFLFAGKAHPADNAGQDLIKHIVEISKMPQFIGKIVFIPNYDITIAKYLVQGVDIWMNTPTRPLEASGTSGEKAVMNGVMHFSVLDGWWVEGYKPNAGWALDMERTYENQDFQDELDAATIYNIIESDIAVKYYDKDENGMSQTWIEIIKNCVADVACDFTTNRMMEDYINQYYNKLSVRYETIVNNDFELAKEIAQWKKKVRREWSMIEVKSFTPLNNNSGNIVLGKEYYTEIKMFIGELDPSDLGIEVILAERAPKGEVTIKEVFDYSLVDFKDGVATYGCKVVPDISGGFQVANRLYAKNTLLAHRQDFELVKWL